MENKQKIMAEFVDVVGAIEHMFGIETILQSSPKYDILSTLYLDKDNYYVEHNITVNGQ